MGCTEESLAKITKQLICCLLVNLYPCSVVHPVLSPCIYESHCLARQDKAKGDLIARSIRRNGWPFAGREKIQNGECLSLAKQTPFELRIGLTKSNAPRFPYFESNSHNLTPNLMSKHCISCSGMPMQIRLLLKTAAPFANANTDVRTRSCVCNHN